MFNVRIAGDHHWEMAVHLVVAGDNFDCVLFYAVLFPKRCLG